MKDQPRLESAFINGGATEKHAIKAPKARKAPKVARASPGPVPVPPPKPPAVAELAPPEPRKHMVMNMPLGLIARLKTASHTYSLKTGRRITQQMIVEQAIEGWLAANKD